MKDIKRILFPVDFSEACSKVAPWVRDVSKKFDSEIHLLFVAPALEQFVGLFVPEVSIETYEGEMTEGAESKMEEFVSAHFADCPECRTRVELGDAAPRILDYIEAEGIDLVVIPTRGRKGLERLFFGSVAEKVLRGSPVPVLAVDPNRVSRAASR